MTFNELLRANGFDLAQVALLRHTGEKGRLGLTPHDLWQRNDGSFDLYQRTQAPDKPLFELPYWASFVSNPAKETLFAGLFGATKGDRSEINWNCPVSGMPPGEDKGRPSDLYHLAPLDALSEHRGRLKIEWDNGWVAWARYARRSDHAILGGVGALSVARFEASPEGEKTWREQLRVERDPRLATSALAANADRHAGQHVCEACNFKHPDRAMFDAHHPHPLLAGPRITKPSDMIVLCPVCHRRAHCSANRMLPYNLSELRAWNEAGRP